MWITSVNNFNPNYSAILLAGIAATASIILNRNLMIIFLILTSIIVGICISYTTNKELSPYVLSLSTIILFAVYFVRETYRKQIVREVKTLNKQLLIFNVNLEDKIVERTKMLEQKNDELEKLTYIVSHDLKAPLRNIGSFAKLIEKKIEKKDLVSISSYTTIINKAVKRMSNIISDLLTYGKIEQNERQLDDTHLPSLIQDIFDTHFSSDLYTNVKFNVSTNFPDVIKCDSNQISLLLENLIGNAIKYNDSTIKFVRVYYEDLKEHHKILIQDNGIGISEKYRDKIFEMFSRLHNESKYEGSGIGLSICKKIVLKHVGEINFFSTHGEGTTFYFTIAKKIELKTSKELEKVI